MIYSDITSDTMYHCDGVGSKRHLQKNRKIAVFLYRGRIVTKFENRRLVLVFVPSHNLGFGSYTLILTPV